ncbi:MAG TPA: hypothetical protein VGB16_04345 [candidate division Zixibacteria bacterium]
MRSRKFLVSLCLLSLLVFVGCAYTTERTHPNFSERRKEIKSIGIMPPEFHMFERTATIDEPKPELDAEADSNIVNALNEVLKEGGFVSVAVPMNDSALVYDQELALDLTRQKQSFDKACDSAIVSKKKTVNLTVDPNVGVFADLAQTDYLLFVRGMGYQTSGGAKAKDVAIGALSAVLFGTYAGSQWTGMVLEIGLVDANSAELLWYNRNTVDQSNYNARQPKSAKKLCKKILEKLVKK